MKSYKLYKPLIILLVILLNSICYSSSKTPTFSNTKTKYSLSWGSCPIKTSGDFAIMLAREFDQHTSLYKLRETIEKEHWKEKFYLSSYTIDYNFWENKLIFKFQCPKPLLKIQVYLQGTSQYYSGILVENGEIFDPQYEIELRRENNLKDRLPFFSISEEHVKNQKHHKIVEFMKLYPVNLSTKLSEVILNNNNELTLIMSKKNKALSVFLGSDYWDEKLTKLLAVDKYFLNLTNYPTQMNLTSLKKIVVKFSAL